MSIYYIGWIKRAESWVNASSEEEALQLAKDGQDEEFEIFTTDLSGCTKYWTIDSIVKEVLKK